MQPEESTRRQIDFDLAKSWIRCCENTHICRSVPLTATRAGRAPLGFTVIDVHERCLIEAGDDVRYLALSYVWGTSNRFVESLEKMRELSMPGSLDTIWDLLAPPIRDAVTLTRKLGERFIWIDAVCISQSGSEGLWMATDNIRSMDSIYRHAVCTIIAADNSSPDNGLAGVDELQRAVNQITAEITPGVRVLARFTPETLMLRSKYRSRGWTYVRFCCKSLQIPLNLSPQSIDMSIVGSFT